MSHEINYLFFLLNQKQELLLAKIGVEIADNFLLQKIKILTEFSQQKKSSYSSNVFTSISFCDVE
jgi:hypothetical protein